MDFLVLICMIYTVICWILPVYLLFKRYISIRIGDKSKLEQMGGYGPAARPITAATANRPAQPAPRPAQSAPQQPRPPQQPPIVRQEQ